jgi:hypothetical protein
LKVGLVGTDDASADEPSDACDVAGWPLGV